MRRGMAGAALGMATYFGAKFMGKALIGFNMKVEESKNQIAAMLSFAKKTSLTDELGNADKLYDSLRKKAAELPGSTQDYVQMLGMITQPLAAAGASLKEMESFTVNSFVLSKGLGESWQKSARDIREFVNFGKLNAVDTFARTVLKNATRIDGKKGGYEAIDSDRKLLKAMSDKQRVKVFESGINSPQVQQMIERQAQSFSGKLDKLKDRFAQFMGKVGEGLFKALKPMMDKLDKWLDKNSAAVEAFAVTLGTKLVGAFNALKDGFLWLVDHKDLVVAAVWGLIGVFSALTLRAVLAWAAIAWPFLLGAGIFAGLMTLFNKLSDVLGTTSAAFVTLMAAFAVYKVLSMVGAIKAMTTALWGQARATAAVTAAQGVGGVGAAGKLAGAAGALAGTVGPAMTGAQIAAAQGVGGVGAAGKLAGAAGALAGTVGPAMTGAQIAAARAAAVQNAAARAVLGVTPAAMTAAAAGAVAMQPNAGGSGLKAAAKGIGAAVAAAAVPITLTLMAAKVLSDLTGGDFLDQAAAKGWTGKDGDLFGALQYLGTKGASGGAATTITNINVGAPNVDITTQDAKGTAQALADTVINTVNVQLREAARNLGKS